MNAIDNVNETTRRGLCLAMAIAIVTFGLMAGAAGVDAAFADAYAHVTTTQVSVVQLAAM